MIPLLDSTRAVSTMPQSEQAVGMQITRQVGHETLELAVPDMWEVRWDASSHEIYLESWVRAHICLTAASVYPERSDKNGDALGERCTRRVSQDKARLWSSRESRLRPDRTI